MTTYEASVTASADDAWQATNGNTNITVTAALVDHVDEWHGFRWDNVTIPKGATIDSAYVEIYCDVDTADEPQHDFYGEDEDNPGVFVAGTGNNNISGRTRTSATVRWSNADLGAPGSFQTPNIKTIIQEIIDRAGWASGQAMVIVCRGTISSRDLRIVYYDEGVNPAPKLHVEYTVGAITKVMIIA